MTDAAAGTGSAQQADLPTVLRDGSVAGHWILDAAGSSVAFHVKHFWGHFVRVEAGSSDIGDASLN
jgi:hypothetical protein